MLRFSHGRFFTLSALCPTAFHPTLPFLFVFLTTLRENFPLFFLDFPLSGDPHPAAGCLRRSARFRIEFLFFNYLIVRENGFSPRRRKVRAIPNALAGDGRLSFRSLSQREPLAEHRTDSNS